MFYDKYAQLCKQKGISKAAAAMEAGLSKSLVTKWKKNNVEVPSPDVLKKLSVYFNMPVSELLVEEELPKNEENPTVQMGSEVDAVTMELMDIIQNGSDEDRQDLLEMYRMLKRREQR